jgi:hypothetical protein
MTSAICNQVKKVSEMQKVFRFQVFSKVTVQITDYSSIQMVTLCPKVECVWFWNGYAYPILGLVFKCSSSLDR